MQELDALPLVPRALRESIDILDHRHELWERPLSSKLCERVVGCVRCRLERGMTPQ